MTLPNFFIVGAPKCGTTAMDSYLGQHPEIYMAPVKEMHHFATDLISPRSPAFSRSQYLGWFSAVKNEKAIGQSAVYYLYSKVAAQNIYQFNPNSRIIVILRNPLDWVASYHAQLLFTGDEDISDLSEALAAESLRKSGVIPVQVKPGELKPFRLFYREIASFSEQLTRYFNVFGHKAIHVILFDDFKENTEEVYRRTLEFLEVDSDFKCDFQIINAAKQVRIHSINKLIRQQSEFWTYSGVLPYIPYSVRRRLRQIYRWLLMANSKRKMYPPLSEDLKRRLRAEFAPEVHKLSRLLERDLTHWLK